MAGAAFVPTGANRDTTQIGREFIRRDNYLARKSDGSAWRIYFATNGLANFSRATNYDAIVAQNFSGQYANAGAYVRSDGTLWIYDELEEPNGQREFRILQSGTETNWVAAVRNWGWMVAIKKDGTLWQWILQPRADFTAPPRRLGIHDDWISVVNVEGGAVTLAADGSLWLWPDPHYYEYSQVLLKLPKQPRFLGNVLN